MHILIGALSALVTIFYLLDRLGIDIGGLNPFYWYRRRAFRKRYGSDPVHSIEDPVHIASLLVIGAAKLDGDLTAEQKTLAKQVFMSEFSLDEREASQLFGSAAHLLAAPELLGDQLKKLVDRNAKRFSNEQAASLIDMMKQVASADGALTGAQNDFINGVRAIYVQDAPQDGTWA